jgi:alkylation response protein AidB-like acyl-CoA dehydrogenase
VIIEPNEEHELLSSTARRFLSGEVPLTKVRELATVDGGFDRDWWKYAADLGWSSLLSVEGEPDLIGLVLIAAEMGRLVSPGPLLPVNVVVSAVVDAHATVLREEVLPRLVSGESIGAWCIAEEKSWGSVGIEVWAEPTVNGFVLNGIKFPVEAADSADWFLVAANSPAGLIQVMVPADSRGITVRPCRTLDLVRRFGEVAFDDVEVPWAGVVTEAPAHVQIERQLELASILLCAEMTGAADRVFDFTLEYMFDRFSFGRALASYQALKHRIADMKTFLEACKGTTEAAAKSWQAADGQSAMLSSVAKAWVGDVVPELIQQCVQLHGGIGVTWEHDLHLYLRRVSVDRNLYGTPSDHRERISSMLVNPEKAGQ